MVKMGFGNRMELVANGDITDPMVDKRNLEKSHFTQTVIKSSQKKISLAK